jgi:formylglycine-generating enzyme required for sulfatase activity
MKPYAITRRSVLLAVVISVLLFPGCASHTLITEPLNPQDGFPPSYTDPYAGVEFIVLPSGSFTMGSPENEKGRDQDEGPTHEVSIESFYIGKYEVTQAQWEKVMGESPSHNRAHTRLPVENVSWDEIQRFLERLNKKTGLTFRLPTEAEWEYACRAGTQTPFCSGSDASTLNEYAWYNINAGDETHLVGTRMPNQWGLYDMHGNVSEYVGDGRRGYLSRKEHNPKGASSSQRAIHRGGCWFYPARLCRSANRMTYEKKLRTHIAGFRLAIDKGAVGPQPKRAK